MEGSAIEQLQRTAQLPHMIAASGMPDLHPGRGYPVGAAFFKWIAWSASLQWRYLSSWALTEDNAVRSEPTSTFNLRLSRDMHDVTGHRSALTLDVFNLLNTPVNDIQYYYASRLPNESAPVDDKVIHPAEPFSIRLTYRMNF